MAVVMALIVNGGVAIFQGSIHCPFVKSATPVLKATQHPQGFFQCHGFIIVFQSSFHGVRLYTNSQPGQTPARQGIF